MTTLITSKKDQIDDTIRTGKKLQIPGGFIAYKAVDHKANTSLRSKYAISVSKKYAKSAVKRNKIRRKIRPIVEKHVTQNKSLFVTIIIKSPVDDIKAITNGIIEKLGNTIH